MDSERDRATRVRRRDPPANALARLTNPAAPGDRLAAANAARGRLRTRHLARKFGNLDAYAGYVAGGDSPLSLHATAQLSRAVVSASANKHRTGVGATEGGEAGRRRRRRFH